VNEQQRRLPSNFATLREPTPFYGYGGFETQLVTGGKRKVFLAREAGLNVVNGTSAAALAVDAAERSYNNLHQITGIVMPDGFDYPVGVVRAKLEGLYPFRSQIPEGIYWSVTDAVWVFQIDQISVALNKPRNPQEVAEFCALIYEFSQVGAALSPVSAIGVISPDACEPDRLYRSQMHLGNVRRNLDMPRLKNLLSANGNIAAGFNVPSAIEFIAEPSNHPVQIEWRQIHSNGNGHKNGDNLIGGEITFKPDGVIRSLSAVEENMNALDYISVGLYPK
jgi:hypothetical protein